MHYGVTMKLEDARLTKQREEAEERREEAVLCAGLSRQELLGFEASVFSLTVVENWRWIFLVPIGGIEVELPPQIGVYIVEE